MEIRNEGPNQVIFTVTLSRDEAIALRAIVGNITGKESGPRGVADKLYKFLGDRDIPSTGNMGVLRLPDTYVELRDKCNPW